MLHSRAGLQRAILAMDTVCHSTGLVDGGYGLDIALHRSGETGFRALEMSPYDGS